jgi:predicted nuclease of restriction endonuclease-like (RecB) superfamily
MTQSMLTARIVAILEDARSGAVRAVNSQMVLAYWLIGREIVQAIQGGEDRASYGKKVIAALAAELTIRFGRGYSETYLRYFRRFYLAFADRQPSIQHSGSAELLDQDTPSTTATLKAALEPTGTWVGFSDMLSWTHYRTLCRVEQRAERRFYEIEAHKAGWSVETLERQMHSFLFARLLKSRNKAGVLALANAGQEIAAPIDAIKHPYVLDFLGLPEAPQLHESTLEAAIIDNLQPFLLELGKGFAFVARQHRVASEFQHFYIDLVFYNYLLKCFVLVDLKMGKLTHQDVGQMDMYVRMFDELRRTEGDNPSVGLILCAEKDEVVARYSVLAESRQLFASKYMLHLPTEEELQRELARERQQIEGWRTRSEIGGTGG